MSKQLQLYTNYFKIDLNKDIFKYEIICNTDLEPT